MESVENAESVKVQHPSKVQQLFEAAGKELELYQPARESFASFWKLTKPDMSWNWFNQKMAEALQRFLEQVLAGRQPRLMIFAPPRHGKSEGASRRFPAWVFGKCPSVHVMACSYAAMLASRMNRDVQRIMDDPVYKAIFPETKLNSENVATLSGKPLRNSEIFETMDFLGSYRSAGVGGGITGQGFDIGIIDDPVADAQAAFSDIVQDGIWEWYQTTFYTRQSPMAGILLIMTRWVTNDLAGKLLEEQMKGGDKWEIIRFPAIAEEDEEYRKEGEVLCPERYDLTRLESIKGTVGVYTWEAMYQQRPGPRGGTLFKRAHWKFWKVVPQIEELLISVDCAFKDLATNDYVAIQVWGRKGAEKFLLRRLRERMGFGATVQAIRNTRAMFPAVQAILVEDKANGSAVIETLQKELPGIIAINPEGGKVARAYSVQPEQEAGNVYLPDPEVDREVEQFLSEASAFPGGPHDDEVDAMTQALNWLRNRASTLGMLHWLEQQLAAREKVSEQRT